MGHGAAQQEPGCLVGLSAMMLVVIVGPAGGLLLAGQLAPASTLAKGVGLATPLACLLLGALLWLGTMLLQLLWRLLLLPFRLLLGRRRRDDGAAAVQVPPGSWVFVPVSLVVAAGAGLLIGLVAADTGVLRASGIFAGAGLVYGVVLWRLARAGYLDPVIEALLETTVG